MNPNKVLWEKGDYTRIARTMRESGEGLVRRAAITPQMKVLDLACGDGTTAIPAAQLGATVLGVDIASNLVACAIVRAEQAGVAQRCRFQEGDARDLHNLDNASFDRVITIFGAMFAPQPFEVAREMVRVTKPGGRIVMGNWIPDDSTLFAQLTKICAAYTRPAPEGSMSPMAWGISSNVIERFVAAGVAADAITCLPATYGFNFSGAPEDFVDTFRHCYGPTMTAFDAAASDGRAQALRSELVRLFESQNQSRRPGMTLIPATFLQVTVNVG
ncbi:MAG: class I SAM-dependent methyltransferase [Ramlibacter sp.]